MVTYGVVTSSQAAQASREVIQAGITHQVPSGSRHWYARCPVVETCRPRAVSVWLKSGCHG